MRVSRALNTKRSTNACIKRLKHKKWLYSRRARALAAARVPLRVKRPTNARKETYECICNDTYSRRARALAAARVPLLVAALRVAAGHEAAA